MVVDEPSSPPADLVGAVLGGRYRLSRLVRCGGMGAVYEASGPDSRRLAVKVLRPSKTEGATARFLREGKIASRLEHRHLVPVLEVGHDDPLDVPFLVMPFLEGRDVGSLLEDTHALSPEIAARIALQACEGLAFMHATEVVHRDIKPSNLFLESSADGSVIVRVCDFGIAKMTGAFELTQLTNTGAVVGTPLYMAPETVRGAVDVDARRDVYGIGATLYEMLAGAPAWSELEGGFGALALAIASEDAPPLRDRAPWVDPALAALVHRAMARDPEARPASARELASLLRPFCGGHLGLTTASLEARRAATPSVPEDPLLGAHIDGRYRVLRLLGRGGMGAVYEAEAPDGERVAVKVISGEIARTESRAIQRFLREAEAVRSIESAYVVRTRDIGTDAALGTPFLVMELLSGVDLGSYLEEHGALEAEPALQIFLEAALGIHAAHERGVIHRDVKPANLFLHTAADGAVTVKVCDFGIAKQAPSEANDAPSHGLTATGGMLGSPRYMSPEQAQDAKRVDRRSDVWSLCIALYETLSGRRAWEECTSLGEIIVAICTHRMKPLREVAPWVDPRIAAIVHRGLAVDPAARWPDMAALAAAIEANARPRTAPLTLADLRPALEAKAVLVADGARLSDPGFSTQRTLERDGPQRRWRGFGLALAAGALMVGGINVYSTGHRGAARPAAIVERPPVTAAPSAVTPPPKLLLVSPEDAVVMVDGSLVTTAAGQVTLEGQPGDAFEVVVSRGAARTSARVYVTRDGRLEPARIALDPAPAVVASAPLDASAPKRPAGASSGARGSSSAPSVTVAPAPSSTGLKPRETW